MDNLEVFENMKIKDLRKLTEDYLKLPLKLLQKEELKEDTTPSTSAEEIINDLNTI